MLAGAFSMGAGEYISMSAQRELVENQIDIERRELAEDPESEQKELEYIYRRKGMPAEAAATVASEMMADPKVALDTHSREELGLDPGQLGSPTGAALSSFSAFVVGAFVPVAPYAFFSGQIAFVSSVLLSGGALFSIGVILSMFTGRGWLFGGVRMLSIGILAAVITYWVGRAVGISTGL
jgi:VIT1/CCC1 family predicted Fe2+/Mn2+ transporter